MASGYGVQWAGEAAAVLAVVSVVAVEFSEKLVTMVDDLTDDPADLVPTTGRFAGSGLQSAFGWSNYVATVVVRLSDRTRTIRVDHVTVESSVGGINPFA